MSQDGRFLWSVLTSNTETSADRSFTLLWWQSTIRGDERVSVTSDHWDKHTQGSFSVKHSHITSSRGSEEGVSVFFPHMFNILGYIMSYVMYVHLLLWRFLDLTALGQNPGLFSGSDLKRRKREKKKVFFLWLCVFDFRRHRGQGGLITILPCRSLSQLSTCTKDPPWGQCVLCSVQTS